MILRAPGNENGEVISSARLSNPSFPNASIGNPGSNLDPRLKHSGVTFQGNPTFYSYPQIIFEEVIHDLTPTENENARGKIPRIRQTV